MTLLSLLSPSTPASPTVNVSALVECDSDLSGTAIDRAAKARSANFRPASAFPVLPVLYSGTKSISLQAEVDSSFSAALYDGTKSVQSLIDAESSLSATLYSGTKGLSATLQAESAMSASLYPSTKKPSCLAELSSTMSVKLPGRSYGSPVTAGSGRS